jgi:hypothetical protein
MFHLSSPDFDSGPISFSETACSYSRELFGEELSRYCDAMLPLALRAYRMVFSVYKGNHKCCL